MPVSTSSKTMVGTASRPNAATSIARLMRASSPPGGDLAQWPRRLAGVGGYQELAALGAGGRGRGLGLRLQFDREDAAAHAQLAQ